MAAHGRYPPWPRGRGLVLGLTAIVVTPEPIGPDEDAALGCVLSRPNQSRIVPLGLIRLNLGQEVMSFALSPTPGDLFPEPAALADALSEVFRRHVPLLPS